MGCDSGSESGQQKIQTEVSPQYLKGVSHEGLREFRGALYVVDNGDERCIGWASIASTTWGRSLAFSMEKNDPTYTCTVPLALTRRGEVRTRCHTRLVRRNSTPRKMKVFGTRMY